ncbi:acyl-CoA carboxylase subunit beta [Bradyrhizobium sp. WSM1417]|uniref:acyl-CoA carboxylase subunit beta n=1 Tax=Bradyrhizobium sp. WSM1417 TaxID=754500 RepID=UPI00056755CD|nr:carboxyl transferase domain-containing protein [Bradyrhizobium sp. WSM1417]
MSWTEEVAELNRRKKLAEQMGGAEGVARQRQRGKLTVRERIHRLADPDSFREFRGLVGTGEYKDDKLVSFVPKPEVEGTLHINGRKAIVQASDFTVRSGATATGQLGQEMSASARATEWRLPLVRLLDTAGGGVRAFDELGRTYLPDGNLYHAPEVRLLSLVPVTSALLGSVAGYAAISAVLSHFSVMVKGISHLFPGGPPVVKAAVGYDITKEELGGDAIHVNVSGCIDNLAETEDDAFAQIRKFLSYLPSSVDEMAPRVITGDPPARADQALLSIVPRNRRRPFDAQKLIELIVDRGSFFQIAPRYGRSRITGLARLNGYTVGIMANNPMVNGGATDVAAGSKAIRLMQLCNTFHLPLISLADEPGVQVGLESEKQGIERAGARLVSTVCLSEMPWCTVVVGRLYGVGGQCHHRPSGMFRRYCWPSACWGSMHIAGGVSAAFRREIEASPDPEAKRREIESRLNAIASPFRTAEATGQDIIDPRETRALLCDFVEDAQRILRNQLGRPPIPYLP